MRLLSKVQDFFAVQSLDTHPLKGIFCFQMLLNSWASGGIQWRIHLEMQETPVQPLVLEDPMMQAN